MLYFGNSKQNPLWNYGTCAWVRWVDIEGIGEP